jgi:hypothetical protein
MAGFALLAYTKKTETWNYHYHRLQGLSLLTCSILKHHAI